MDIIVFTIRIGYGLLYVKMELFLECKIKINKMERNFRSMFTSVVNYVNIIPYLYRYENKEYIDRFFETGELMISSFFNYKQYDDNQLGDKKEGSTLNYGDIGNGKEVGTFTIVGQNSFCFCTSTILDEKLLKVFKRDSVFQIRDPMNFILQIEKCLFRIIEVFYGNCIYVSNKIIKKEIPHFSLDDLKVNEESTDISLEKLMQVTQPLNGPEQFFLKNLSYQQQSEYRILWNSDREVKEGIIIKCPEAIQFCEKIEF